VQLQLLGTAAAEGWPAPFCSCRACDAARKLGGRNIRRRSSALLDENLLIDFGPDTSTQIQAFGRNLSSITTLIYTHHHGDHISPFELTYRSTPFAVDTDLPILCVYGNETVVDILSQTYPDSERNTAKFRIRIERPLLPFEERRTDDGIDILPLAADHAPKALVFRLTCQGRRLFYGHDSGQYPDETVEALRGASLDVALFDTTYGAAPSSNRGHMGIDGVLAAVERLRSVGAVTDTTQLIATHFSHNGQVLYDELREKLEPHCVSPAYDGMIVEF